MGLLKELFSQPLYSGAMLGDVPIASPSNGDESKLARMATDAIPGGKAAGKPDSDFSPAALKQGQKVELEHTTSPAIAKEIAKDHLVEDPQYYDKLKQVESRANAGTLDNIRNAALEVDPNPSEDQKAAGNYRKGHLTWNGLPITIETAKGQTRSGTGHGGKQWSIDLEDHYGYIKRTESEADGDHIDVFLCENHPDSEIVFVVNQMRPDGSFDEHKVILGQCCKSDAKAAYLRNYSAGWTGCGSIVPMTLAEFKQWIENGDTAKAV